jgi:starch synthase
LGDYSAALASHLAMAGHDVRLFLPFYGRVDRSGLDFGPVEFLQQIPVSMGHRELSFSGVYSWLPERSLQIFMIDCPELYGRASIYTEDPDEAVRFAFLCRAALESCQRMAWSPQIVHCNDWHTAIMPLYLRTLYGWDGLLRGARSLLTIHNIGYQGVFGAGLLEDLGLSAHWSWFDQADLANDRINLLKAGIDHADYLSTVSPTHAAEIQSAEHGMGLEERLRQRSDRLAGILNGVDYREWDPVSDALIAYHYSPEDLKGKEDNTRVLLHDLSLPYDPQAPVLGMVSRLVEQKGIALVQEVLPAFLEQLDVRLVVLGSGKAEYEAFFRRLQTRFPRQVCFYQGYNYELAHRIEAGADLFLMPSLYEPCGLNQMYSLRYGTVPVVRKTGGLADAVQQWDADNQTGTGFLFEEYSAAAFSGALHLALETFRDQLAWRRLVLNGMAQDFSWDRQVTKYVSLYRNLADERPL